MPRKDFQSDLAKASAPGLFPRLRDIRSGEDDGSIHFVYTVPLSTQLVEIHISVPDTSQYPHKHTYFAFAATDNSPEVLSTVLESFQPSTICSKVQEFLQYVSDCFDNAILGLSLTEDDAESMESPLLDEDDSDWGDEDEEILFDIRDDPAVIAEIRADMRIVKAAGYRGGYLGQLTGPVIISVSCRIEKLGVSDEAMRAWNVRPSEYLVLLLRYPYGYKRLSSIINREPSKGPPFVEMRVGACDSYKPGLNCVRQIFNSKTTNDDLSAGAPDQKDESKFKSIFIGDSLCALLNTNFIQLLAYRLECNFSWTGAELCLNDNRGKVPNELDARSPQYHVPEDWDGSTPEFLKADHIYEADDSSQLSFPLLAMQFTLRRFVRCAEFCLNCNCKIDSGFEALKPYVCSKGLCLYQYMKLGMGPNVEWEILSQPYVVDLLISFAYARATAGLLTDFPSGLGLRVPKMNGNQLDTGFCDARLDATEMVLELKGSVKVSTGDWIIVMNANSTKQDSSQWHFRVLDSALSPFIQLSTPVCRNDQSRPMGPDVCFRLYSEDFDEMNIEAKRAATVMLLDTLPDVDSMRSFMTSNRHVGSERPLASWSDRISPAALDVLRWVVASNRSCIMYDEDPEDQISGVAGYLQFRLAQGAPDKEQRFVHAVKSKSAHLKYPTIFAWHGSPLYNWHSILREGLHFKQVANGRAYGDGVYMSNCFDTSRSFSFRAGLPAIFRGSTQATCDNCWPNSNLKIKTALSLNEVVNAPNEFVYATSYYVVDRLEWIQTRYLFVECLNPKLKSPNPNPKNLYHQDPNYSARGPGTAPMTIPMSALSSRRHQILKVDVDGGSGDHNDDEDDKFSIATLAEDKWLVESASEDAGEEHQPASDYLSKTDFRLGELQQSSLNLLGPPQYATTQATKCLQQHLQATLKVQERVPLNELGWYIDPNLINNVYQWIAELHSFDPSLPLARDLKNAGLTSIVFELRFPSGFPMSPPFVRVIRPRFLLYSRGGGGHVTAGGSICLELLTTSGWSPVSSIESVLLQVRMAITNMEPQPARLDPSNKSEYSVGEAVQAYTRVCQMHGWEVPNDLQGISWK